ncbi:unnamed protein product [Protopolystoma xenopodis]|uniref:Uncharacterized protein n=1 Tax=Protopolystoma xenopodis TaxID=117903 RepID=A0A3S5FF90_9PLAT|nr:unnamed protein product [Protopolystoma xenopodis]
MSFVPGGRYENFSSPPQQWGQKPQGFGDYQNPVPPSYNDYHQGPGFGSYQQSYGGGPMRGGQPNYRGSQPYGRR